MKIIKKKIWIFIGIFIGIIGIISVYAATLSSSNMTFSTSGVTGATQTTTKGALDELYTKAYTYPVFLNGNHVTFSPATLNMLKGSTATVTVTPELGYYITAGSCTNGYTISGLNVSNLAATAAQTITISNNSKTTSSTCTFTVTPGIPSCSGCVFVSDTSTTFYEASSDNAKALAFPGYTYNFGELNARVFLGFVLDTNRKISSAYICGLRADNASFCIQAPFNVSNYSSIYDSNTRLASTIFSNCTTTTTSCRYQCSDTSSQVCIGYAQNMVSTNSSSYLDCRCDNPSFSCYCN